MAKKITRSAQLTKAFNAANKRYKKKYANGGTVPKYPNGTSGVVPLSALQIRDNYQTSQGINPAITMDPYQMNTNTFGDFGTQQGAQELLGGQGAFDWQGSMDMTGGDFGGGLQQSVSNTNSALYNNVESNAGLYSAGLNIAQQGLQSLEDNPYNQQYGTSGTSAAGQSAAALGGPVASVGASALGVIGTGLDQLVGAQDYNEYGVNEADETKAEIYQAGMAGLDQMGQLTKDAEQGDWWGVLGDLSGLSQVTGMLDYETEQDEAKQLQKTTEKAENLRQRQLNEQTPNVDYAPTLTYPNGGTIKGPLTEDPQTAFYNDWLNQRRSQLGENMAQQQRSFGQNLVDSYAGPEGAIENEYNRQIRNVARTPYFTDSDKINQYVGSSRSGRTPYYYPGDKDTRAVYVPEYRDNTSDEVHEKTHSAKADPQESKIGALQETEAFYNANYSDKDYLRGDAAYYNDPSEQYSRLMELRYNNKIDPKNDPSLDDIRGYRVKNDAKTDEDKNALFDMYDNQQLETLLKEVAVNAPQKKNDMMIAAYGGISTKPNAELETKEVFRTPDGSIEKVPEGTPSHANGGVKMTLPEGTEILGKMKGKYSGKTYKDLGQNIKKRYDKYDKAVTDSKNPLSKRTAQRMLDKVQSEFDTLMDEQEVQGMVNKYKEYTPEQVQESLAKFQPNVQASKLDPNVMESIEYAKGGKIPKYQDPNKSNNYSMTVQDKYKWYTGMDASERMKFTNYYDNYWSNPDNTFQPDTQYTYARTGSANAFLPLTTGNVEKFHDPTSMGDARLKQYTNQVGGAKNLYGTADVAGQLYAGPYQDYLVAQPGWQPKASQDALMADINKYQKYNQPKTTSDLGAPAIPQERFNIPAGYDDATINAEINALDANITSGDFTGGMPRSRRGDSVQYQTQGSTPWWSTAGQLAPAAYNVGMGLFGKEDYLDDKNFRSPYEGRIMSQMGDRRYNIKPQLEANELAYQTARRNVRQMAPGVGGYLSNVGALAGGRMRADAGAYAMKQNMENQWRGQDMGTMAQLGAQRSQTALGIAQYNAQVDAAKQGALSTGIDQLAGAAYNIGNTRNKQYNDQLTREALQAYLSGHGTFNV